MLVPRAEREFAEGKRKEKDCSLSREKETKRERNFFLSHFFFFLGGGISLLKDFTQVLG